MLSIENRISFISPQPNTHRYDYQVYSSEISELISTIAAYGSYGVCFFLLLDGGADAVNRNVYFFR
jgi:hypothetical protein